jgi:hypothetical protein
MNWWCGNFDTLTKKRRFEKDLIDNFAPHDIFELFVYV